MRRVARDIIRNAAEQDSTLRAPFRRLTGSATVCWGQESGRRRQRKTFHNTIQWRVSRLQTVNDAAAKKKTGGPRMRTVIEDSLLTALYAAFVLRSARLLKVKD